MVTFPDPATWAEHEFGLVSLGDPRRRNRLVSTMTILASRPEGSLPQRLDWNELRAFYRLVDQPTSTLDTLQATHRLRTRERMNRPDPVLIVHDTTEMDFTSHQALHPQIGPIGNAQGQGILQHNSLAFAPKTRELLGLVYQPMELRTPKPQNETRSKRKKRSQRESHLWTDGVQGVGPAPGGCQWLDVADAGGDFFGWMQASQALGHGFLIRLCRDRCVTLEEPTDTKPIGSPERTDSKTTEHLLQAVRQLPQIDARELQIASRGKRPARKTHLSIAWQRQWIEHPQGEKRFQGASPIELTVVRVWEAHPPEGEVGLEWVLGYSGKLTHCEEAWEIRDWYEYRWAIAEEYHKVEKTGCGEEQLRFETWPRMRAALAVLSVLAVRVLGLRWQLDHQPQARAEEVASEMEIEVLAKISPGPPSGGLTVKWFVQSVAKLGGYLGRKGDGPPGWQSLWRGYQRLADILWGIELLRKPHDSG